MIVFPLVVAGREFVVFVLQDPSWAPLLSFFDAGGQRSVSRSVLRALLIGGCLVGLLLPTSQCERSGRSIPWIGLFLLSGLLSVGLSGRVYTAEMEWETWALLVLLAVMVRRMAVPGLRVTALVGLYTVTFAVFFHALWISVPVTTTRLGGVFHHPNALSTFTLFVLPFLINRACRGGVEGYFASFLVGTTMGLQLWSGSLTGASILLAGLTFWLTSSHSTARRVASSVLVFGLPVLFNLWGGWVSVLGFSTLFLILLFLAIFRLGSRHFTVTLVALVSLTASCAVFALLAPDEMSAKSAKGRANSVTARLEFYGAALLLTAEEPVLGQGPSAFTREYPRYQESVQYFSRYVHCVPLEILMEWGILGFFLGVMACYRAVSESSGEDGRVAAWAFAAFGLHCLTGVQSQFPYLLVLVALAWALTREPPKETVVRSFWVGTLSRIFLTVALLALLSLNVVRFSSALDQNLGGSIFSSPDPKARALSLRLFSSSVQSQPMDGESLLAYAKVQMRLGNRTRAEALAVAAIETDRQWAAPRRVQLLSGPVPPRSKAVVAALETDGVNYPLFYRLQAESLVAQGEHRQALEVLLSRAPGYAPELLNRLHEFRAEDLEEQLVEYWLLVSLLEEKAGRPALAEAAFRRSLFFTRRSLPRYRAMVDYPSKSGLEAGPIVTGLLAQLAQQLPAK